jgi:hypothetical protein
MSPPKTDPAKITARRQRAVDAAAATAEYQAAIAADRDKTARLKALRLAREAAAKAGAAKAPKR